MKISTKGRYALRVMIDLSLYGDGKDISLKDIAKRQEISYKYLEQIISLLNTAGYLETARGNTGVYKLAKDPKEYIVGDILSATEGDLAPIYCLTENGECNRQKVIVQNTEFCDSIKSLELIFKTFYTIFTM